MMNVLTTLRRPFTAAKERYTHALVGATAIVLAGNASAGYDIGAPTTGPFAKLGAFMQEVIDFIDGPTVLFIAVVSIALVALLLAVAPKSGPVAIAVRVVIGLIVGLNIATWVVALKG